MEVYSSYTLILRNLVDRGIVDTPEAFLDYLEDVEEIDPPKLDSHRQAWALLKRGFQEAVFKLTQGEVRDAC